MSFSESLTVRILGDSSGLQRELDSVLSRFDELRENASAASDAARQLSSSLSRLSQAIGPVQQVSSAISRLGQQLQSISQRPLTLNVSPALQSLQRLGQAAQLAAQAIRAIPPVPSQIPLGGPVLFPAPMAPAGPVRQFATGGLVAGPSGIDRVSARLTSGEYVINRSAVETLGLGLLDQLNSRPERYDSRQLGGHSRPIALRESRRTSWGGAVESALLPQPVNVPSLQIEQTRNSSGFPPRTASHAERSPSQQTNNHFGGITIQVENQIETESLIRNLQLQGIGRRIRQG